VNAVVMTMMVVVMMLMMLVMLMPPVIVMYIILGGKFSLLLVVHFGGCEGLLLHEADDAAREFFWLILLYEVLAGEGVDVFESEVGGQICLVLFGASHHVIRDPYCLHAHVLLVDEVLQSLHQKLPMCC